MKKVIFSSLMITVLSLLLLTCTEDSNPIDSNTPVVDPITNIWTNVADSSYTFFFNTHDSTVSRGIFWGTEEHPSGVTSELCGFFDKSYIEFDLRVGATERRTKFKGKFINSNRMELQSAEGALVLTR
jgi:hypothetical protein